MRFGELSNMCSNFPIEYAGQVWFSSEALYQCCRFPNNYEAHHAINIPNAMVSKMKSKPFRALTRSDWNCVRVGIMEAVVRLKTDQHFSIISQVLVDTAHSPIVEKSRNDQFWGAVPKGEILTGDNVLGLIWELIREEIRDGSFHANVSLDIGEEYE